MPPPLMKSRSALFHEDMEEKSESGSRPYAYNRKMKSLGLLCSNFVSLYNRDDVETVGLDDAAMKLGVERRRIYDIVNVMESVGVLARKEKNRYLWIGFKGIPGALQQLKEEAVKEQNGASVEHSAAKVSDDEGEDKISDQNDDDGEGKSYYNDTATKPRSAVERKEKSLGQLTQNFVKLLLTTNADMVSLDEAARLLLGDFHDFSHPNAAKVRRLYDIANVLSSLNLIEKTHQSDTRKPAFRWLGTKGRCESVVTVALPPAAQKSSKRMFGMELTNMDVKRSLTSLVDKKPGKAQMPSQDLRECTLAAQMQLKGSKSFVFGPFNPPKLPKEEVAEKEVKQVHDFESIASSLCPSYHNQVMQLKGSKSFVFGPFNPPKLPKEEVAEKEVKQVHDFESIASSLCPSYHNQALHDLFTHYLEAYNSWFAEITGGSKNMQQSFKKPFPIQHT